MYSVVSLDRRRIIIPHPFVIFQLEFFPSIQCVTVIHIVPFVIKIGMDLKINIFA